MSQLFRFPDAVKRCPSIETWMRWQKGELGEIARHWFEVIRRCGSDVRQLVHDGHPTACDDDAAFAYVDIRGELHAHTTSSGGSHAIEEMAARGYDYLGITDHSQSLKIALGVAVADL